MKSIFKKYIDVLIHTRSCSLFWHVCTLLTYIYNMTIDVLKSWAVILKACVENSLLSRALNYCFGISAPPPFSKIVEDMLGALHNKRGAAISNHIVSLSHQRQLLHAEKNTCFKRQRDCWKAKKENWAPYARFSQMYGKLKTDCVRRLYWYQAD